MTWQLYADGEQQVYSGTFSILVKKDAMMFKTLIDKGAQITPKYN